MSLLESLLASALSLYFVYLFEFLIIVIGKKEARTQIRERTKKMTSTPQKKHQCEKKIDTDQLMDKYQRLLKKLRTDQVLELKRSWR